MRTLTLLLVLSAGLLAAGCGSSATSTALDPAAARQALIDRNWVSVWPTGRDEQLQVFRFVPGMGGGVFQDRTIFRGSFELFQFEASGDEIRFVFPHDGQRVRTPYRIEEIDGPDPFTHRLTLETTPRGPAVYYGWDEGQRASPLSPIGPL